jgi:hypothetical protein
VEAGAGAWAECGDERGAEAYAEVRCRTARVPER